jgi:hypothetical protein
VGDKVEHRAREIADLFMAANPGLTRQSAKAKARPIAQTQLPNGEYRLFAIRLVHGMKSACWRKEQIVGLTYPVGTALYIAPVTHSWDDLQGVLGVLEVEGTTAVGFVPVYDTYDAFKADYPDMEPIIVSVLQKSRGYTRGRSGQNDGD